MAESLQNELTSVDRVSGDVGVENALFYFERLDHESHFETSFSLNVLLAQAYVFGFNNSCLEPFFV